MSTEIQQGDGFQEEEVVTDPTTIALQKLQEFKGLVVASGISDTNADRIIEVLKEGILGESDSVDFTSLKILFKEVLEQDNEVAFVKGDIQTEGNYVGMKDGQLIVMPRATSKNNFFQYTFKMHQESDNFYIRTEASKASKANEAKVKTNIEIEKVKPEEDSVTDPLMNALTETNEIPVIAINDVAEAPKIEIAPINFVFNEDGSNFQLAKTDIYQQPILKARFALIEGQTIATYLAICPISSELMSSNKMYFFRDSGEPFIDIDVSTYRILTSESAPPVGTLYFATSENNEAYAIYKSIQDQKAYYLSGAWATWAKSEMSSARDIYAQVRNFTALDVLN